jgi:1-acyl-sn-glycerol-3-phosphate acyltransferase
MIIARHLAPAANHYGPMQASALRRYGFMRKLGLFPVDTQSARAAANFLRTADLLLGRANTVFWITPEGHFTDVRRRPIEWRAGVAALAAKQLRCTIVPLASDTPSGTSGFPRRWH